MSIQEGYVYTTDSNGATTWSNPTSAVLTGFLSGTGTITATDTILTAIQKLDGEQSVIETILIDATSLNVPSTLAERDGTGMSAFGEVQTDSIENFTGTTGGTIDIASQPSTGTLNLGCGTGVQIVNIGTGSGTTTINLGATGDTTSIQGTQVAINTANLDVVDKTITLNANGGVASGANSGIDIEENGTIKGYVRVSADRSKWLCKAPTSSLEFDITITQTGTSSATANTLAARDASGRTDFVSVYTTNLNVNSIDMTQEATTLTGEWIGARSTIQYTIKLKRIGDIVYINIPPIGSDNATSAFSNFGFYVDLSGTPIPSGFRPSTSSREAGYCQITYGTLGITTYTGAVVITNTGGLSIDKLNGAFTVGEPSGWVYPINFSFRIV